MILGICALFYYGRFIIAGAAYCQFLHLLFPGEPVCYIKIINRFVMNFDFKYLRLYGYNITLVSVVNLALKFVVSYSK